MGIGYTRQSSADIVDGLPITAAPLNNEFNAVRDAFNMTNGHSHDGTTGEGPKIDLTSAVQGILPLAQGGTGATSLPKASGGDLRVLTDDIKFTTPKTHADAMSFVPIAVSGNFILALDGGFNRDITLNGNSTFAVPTDAKDGLSGTLILRQDSTGSRTASWNAFWDFGVTGVPTLSTPANSVDYVFYQIVPVSSGGTSYKAICTFRSAT